MVSFKNLQVFAGFRDENYHRNTECLTFTKKMRKFQLECKCKGYFGLPDQKISEINGTSSEVVQNSQPKYPEQKMCVPFAFSTSSRPFGLYSSRWKCPWKWNMHIQSKFPFWVLMHPIYCHFRPTGFSD